MNEETGELDGTLQTLSGDVYDLTNGKVSIMLDPETYKSPYKILQDISKIWNELTDVQQAQLAERLFGKNRANIGVAILSNFKQAEAAMESMQNSAGAADKEMEIITNSLTYKLNALRETGTGIWQNLFQRESIGGVVDDLTTLLGVVEKFTDKFGLLGTIVGAGGAGNILFRFFKEWKAMSDAQEPDMSFINILQRAFPSVRAGVEAYNASLASGSTAMTAFGAGAKALGASLAPLIAILVAVGAAFAGFKYFDYVNTGWTRAQESAQKAVTSYQEAKDKLDSLKQEKDDNLSKVQEIAAKYDISVDGMDDVDAMIEKIRSSDKGITLVDQAELEKLSQANTDLETQIKIQEQIANARKQAAIAETEQAAQTEKSYWEEVKERHGKGILGTIAAGWDYFAGNTFRATGNKPTEQQEYEERDTTNLGMAKTAYEELIAKKQELQKLDNEMANSQGGVTDEQIKRHEQLTNEIAEQGAKTGALINTVSNEMKGMEGSTSAFSRDYMKSASQLIRDFNNMDATPAEAALNNLNAFFDGTTGKNAIKEQLVEAAKSGEDLESTLRGLGLSLQDLDISDASYLKDYFNDLVKEVEDADDEVQNLGKTVSEVEEAGKTANADNDWSTIQTAYKKAGELLKEGKTGVDDFQTVAQFMSPKNLGELAKQAKDAGDYASNVYQKAFEDAQSKADRWFGEDETQSMKNFVDDMQSSGLFDVDKAFNGNQWDVATQFETTAEAAEKMGTSVGVVETMLQGLEAYGYDFSNIEKSGEMLNEYSQTLDALNQTYESMAEGDAKDRLDQLLNGDEGFNSQYEKFQTDLSELSKEQVVRIRFEYDLASIQNQIDEIQKLIDAGDNSVSNNAALIAKKDQYVETAEKGLGLDQEGIKLPVEYELAQDAESSLKAQLAQTTDNREKIVLQAEIENRQQVQQDVLTAFADAHPEITPEMSVDDINAALASTFSDNTIHFKASVDGVESELQAVRNEDGTISYTANIDGVETEVEQVTEKDGTVSYTAEVKEELPDKELNKEGKINYSTSVTDTNTNNDKTAKVTYSKDSSAVDNYQATDKQAKVSFSADTKEADGYKPTDKQAKVVFGKDSAVPDGYKPTDKHATVVFGKDSSAPDGYSPSDKHATVHYSADTGSLPNSFSTITRYVNYVKTGAVSVDGTAHADGTAYAKGTAFAHGNWGTVRSGVALGGELGRKHFASVHGDMYSK